MLYNQNKKAAPSNVITKLMHVPSQIIYQLL